MKSISWCLAGFSVMLVGLFLADFFHGESLSPGVYFSLSLGSGFGAIFIQKGTDND